MGADALVSPSYDDACLTQVMPSALAALGLEGFENPLRVPNVERIAMMLVDGLGWRQLRRHADVAPFLSAVAEGAAGTGGPISTPFPSTTATSLASIGTGLPPGLHGLVGYAFRVPGHDDRVMNALRWQLYGQGPQVGLGAEMPPATFQPFDTMFELARSGGIDVASPGLNTWGMHPSPERCYAEAGTRARTPWATSPPWCRVSFMRPDGGSCMRTTRTWTRRATCGGPTLTHGGSNSATSTGWPPISPNAYALARRSLSRRTTGWSTSPRSDALT